MLILATTFLTPTLQYYWLLRFLFCLRLLHSDCWLHCVMICSLLLNDLYWQLLPLVYITKN